MKHYLNFKPSIVFRKGSSFMLKTSLLILYGLPLVLVFFWSYNFFVISALNEFYADASEQLRIKSRDFNAEIMKTRPDAEELKKLEKSYVDYRQLGNAFKTTFNGLFEALELHTPGAVKFTRISVKPEKLVRVIIEGEAEKLSDLTRFVGRLYSSTDFLNPQLKRHILHEQGEKVNFSLEVDYLGRKGELP